MSAFEFARTSSRLLAIYAGMEALWMVALLPTVMASANAARGTSFYSPGLFWSHPVRIAFMLVSSAFLWYGADWIAKVITQTDVSPERRPARPLSESLLAAAAFLASLFLLKDLLTSIFADRIRLEWPNALLHFIPLLIAIAVLIGATGWRSFGRWMRGTFMPPGDDE